MPNSYEVRSVGESLPEYSSIAAESLLVADPSTWKTYVDRVGIENFRGVFSGSRLVGGLCFYRMGQWFGGHQLDCAGYSGVAINSADRGRGACGQLLRQTLRENFEEGFPLAALYASTQQLYRSVGFEQAGVRTQYELPMSSIGPGCRDLDIHRFAEPPIDLLDRVASERARNSNGNPARTHGMWQRLIHPFDCHGTVTYLLGNLQSPEGYLIIRSATRAGGVPQALVSSDLAANTPAALERLMALIYDHRSMCDGFVWNGPPNDSFLLSADEQFAKVRDTMRWMLRILNVREALSQRGYPPDLRETLHLHIDDPLIEENRGAWTLSVDGGEGRVQRGGDGTIRIEVRALAPLFSGMYSASELALLGRLQSTSSTSIQAADRVFAGSPPWMVEIF